MNELWTHKEGATVAVGWNSCEMDYSQLVGYAMLETEERQGKGRSKVMGQYKTIRVSCIYTLKLLEHFICIMYWRNIFGNFKSKTNKQNIHFGKHFEITSLPPLTEANHLYVFPKQSLFLWHSPRSCSVAAILLPQEQGGKHRRYKSGKYNNRVKHSVITARPQRMGNNPHCVRSHAVSTARMQNFYKMFYGVKSIFLVKHTKYLQERNNQFHSTPLHSCLFFGS